jgi:XapX domain-containing protein
MDQVVEVLKAFVVGAVLGGIFMVLKLPIPAPPTFAGVAGIVGIFAGFLVVKKIIG